MRTQGCGKKNTSKCEGRCEDALSYIRVIAHDSMFIVPGLHSPKGIIMDLLPLSPMVVGGVSRAKRPEKRLTGPEALGVGLASRGLEQQY